MPERGKLILILGAHRSGTSLCAAAVEALGAELALPEYYVNDENRKGFFEHPDIVEFNDRLLAYLGGVWDNALFDGAAALARKDIASWLDEAQALFGDCFGGKPVVALKDPRLCQLLQFWLQAFSLLGYSADNIYLVHTLRHPAEVALSQQKRAASNPAFYEIGQELIEGGALWLSLTAQSIAQSRGFQCHSVAYADLLAEPEQALSSLSTFLSLPLPPSTQAFAERFVDPALHRSVHDPSVEQQLRTEFPQVIEFYEALLAHWVSDPNAQEGVAQVLAIYQRPDTRAALAQSFSPALSRLSERSRRDGLELEQRAEIIEDFRQQTDEYVSVIEPLREQITSLERGIVELRQQRDAETADKARVARELEDAKAEIEEMLGSHSWRVTQPLRDFRTWQIESLRSLRRRVAQFRIHSVYTYHRLSIRHPRLAWFSRRALRPLFRLLKLVAAGADPFPRKDYDSGLLLPLIYQQYEESGHYAPLVSIIVPNYNHAEYLRLRLESIYTQSYKHIEVILLDDGSSDGSEEILEEYRQKYPDITRVVLSQSNSGGVFYQWEKGLGLASGEVVWIAESDDWCTDNLLETLVPFFENEAVQLAYTKTIFMNGAGSEEQWSIGEYLYDIDPQRWNDANIETAHHCVAHAFAYKNIIPNVSSAVFRHPGRLEIIGDPQWKKMRICGDWIFYLHVMRGGLIAYSPDACNYYRMHGQNTSVNTYSQDVYFQEHEAVARTVQQYYAVDSEVFEVQRKNLIGHWRHTRDEFSQEAFDACYSLERIQAETRHAPNLLMASYGFCAGGGETFPVELANLMKSQGYNVTYLDFAQEPRNEGVRGKLRADIPVVSDYTQLERIVEDFGVDIVHSHHAWVDSTVLELLPATAPCRTVVTLHGMYETIHDHDLESILPRLVERSACLIYVAEKNLTALQKHGLRDQARLVRIENALSNEGFEQISRSALQLPEDAFVLSLISRAMEEKGWREAIQIVTEAREIHADDIHLLLIGDGAECDRLQKVELPPFVHLLGYQQNVRGYFAVADVGFLPSKFLGESAPLVIIECLQADRPFLASRLGEIPAMLQGDTGLAGELVELDGVEIDIKAWSEKIAHLARHPEAVSLMGSHISSAVSKFDPERMAVQHDETYRSVLPEFD